MQDYESFKEANGKQKKGLLGLVAGLFVLIIAIFLVLVLLSTKEQDGKQPDKPKKTEEKITETTPQPTATPTPVPDLAESIQEMRKASVGDYVTFGSYEQDNDMSNGAEAIEWQVLDKKDGKVLLMSKYALDVKPYHEKQEAVTWETCTLRSWLNNEFYNTAFGSGEQKYIAESYLSNADNSKHGTNGGNATYDKVFLLSIGESTTYFYWESDVEDPARGAGVTEYAKAQGAWTSELEEFYGNGWLWLRSPGETVTDAAGIYSGGHVDYQGYYVDDTTHVIRPALRVVVE